MTIHESMCPFLIGGVCACTPVTVLPGVSVSYPKPQRLDSHETFEVEFELTPEWRAKLAAAADPKCVICLGCGLRQDASGKCGMCSCAAMSSAGG
jgi:hypothetical protein